MGLNEVLRQLEQSGEIARIRKNRYVLPSEADLVTGTLHVHQAGYAFLSPGEAGRAGSFHCRRKYRHRDARRQSGGANYPRRTLRTRARAVGIAPKAG